MDNLNIRKKIPVVLIVIGLTISIVSLIMLAINAFTVRITIPYECCDFMFGCSTEEFFDRDGLNCVIFGMKEYSHLFMLGH